MNQKYPLILLALLLSQYLSAINIGIDSAFKKKEIGYGLNYITTDKNYYTIDSFLNNTNKINLLYSHKLLVFEENQYKNDVWITFNIINQTNKIHPLVLELKNSLIDWVEFYLVKDHIVLSKNIAAEELTFYSRLVKYRNYSFPINIEPKDTVTLYIKCNLDGRRFHLPIILYSQLHFIEIIAKKEIILGCYYGIITLIVLLFFYLYFLLKDKVFLLFAIYMFFQTLSQASLSGITNAYLWPWSDFWADRSVGFFIAASMVTGLWFGIEFIQRENFKKWQLNFIYLVQTLALIIVVGTLGNSVMYNFAIWLLYKLIVVYYLAMFALAIIFYYRKYLPARILILAYIASTISILVVYYYSFGNIHENVFTNSWVITGELLKCILLSFALLDRLRIFKEDNEKAQNLVIAQLEEINFIKEKANAELAVKVEQKSNELFEKQKEVKRALLMGEENERKRIAQELHDGMGSLLSTLRLNAESIDLSNKNLKHSEELAYRNVIDLIDKACTELRLISHNMVPAGLEHFGLKATLQSLVNKINSNSNLNIELDTLNIVKNLPLEIEINLYRIVLELLNNIIKHAHANAVTIQIINQQNLLVLIVEDDGIGFDFNLENTSGIGLISVKSRVDALSGTINFDSVANRGTTIIIELPIK